MDSTDSSLYGPSITIEVGTLPTEFSVNESLLVNKSGFFEGALSGYFVESRTRKIPLHEDDPATFRHLLTWLHTGKLDRHDDNGKERDDDAYAQEENEKLLNNADELFRLLILGDKLQMPTLQNATMRSLIELTAEHTRRPCPGMQIPSNGTLEIVYDSTQDTSPLRALSVDMALLTGATHGFVESMKNLSPEVFLVVATRAITLWNQETSCSSLARHQHLIDNEHRYLVGSRSLGPLVLPCSHVIHDDPYIMVPCDHQKTHSSHLAIRNPTLSVERTTLFLVAECADGKGGWCGSRIDLNDVVANNDGEFNWVFRGQTGDFINSARRVEFRTFRGLLLIADLRTCRGSWQSRKLELSEKIVNVEGRLHYIH